jgi:hypothetical protein
MLICAIRISTPWTRSSSPALRGQTPTQSVHQQNQFGGSVSGPLVKDKLFGFLTYDGYRKVTPIQFTSQTPTSSLVCPNPALVAITAAQCAAALSFIATDSLGTFPRLLRQDIALGKLDYQINTSNHICRRIL